MRVVSVAAFAAAAATAASTPPSGADAICYHRVLPIGSVNYCYPDTPLRSGGCAVSVGSCQGACDINVGTCTSSGTCMVTVGRCGDDSLVAL
jgi:hypothetical protein